MKSKLLILLLLIPQFASAYYVNHPCCDILQACGWWGNADFMVLQRKKRFFPPLVTSNPTAAPILGAPGTVVDFGGKSLDSPWKNGFGGDLGIWISRCVAVGLSAWTVNEDQKKFSMDGGPTGTPFFGQPFFDTALGIENVNLLSFSILGVPLNINGHVDIETNNRIWGFDLFGRYRFLNLCNLKFDLLAGFLYNTVDDNISVNTRSTFVVGPTTTSVSDNIAAENQFYSGLVGFVIDWRSCSWAINIVGKLGVGSMHKQVKLHGLTTIFGPTGVISTTHSGFLVQPSNRGTFTHNEFEVVPQINARLHLKIWSHIWLTAGYTYIFWPSVDLAGEEIDLNINNTQTTVLVGAPSPTFHEKSSNFWVQGFTAGLYFCY